MSKRIDDYVTEVYAGRLPWDDPPQIQAICDAIMLYEQDTSPRMTRGDHCSCNDAGALRRISLCAVGHAHCRVARRV